MRDASVAMRRIGRIVVSALAIMLAPAARAQTPSLEGKTAEQAYKNIQVLQGTPATELMLSMHLMKSALGVECVYCHEVRDFAGDAKEPKQTARKMMQMVLEVNRNTFGGRQSVTCYTCHRGRSLPIGVPVLPVDEPKQEVSPELPSTDRILTNYVQALGGEEAMRRVTTRVITATQYIPTGPGGTIPIPAQTETYQKAPNLVLNVYRTPTFTISDGFDGTTKWTQDAAGRVSDAIAIDQARARRSADFYESVNLRREYTKLTVSGMERVNDRDAYVVIGYPPADRPERLYFDARTGLLVRKLTALPTPVGDTPFQVDYEDYRDAGHGVKLPFVIHMLPATPRTELAPSATVRIQKVEENVPIDASKFAKPRSTAAPQR